MKLNEAIANAGRACQGNTDRNGSRECTAPGAKRCRREYRESTDALRADVQATIDFINENILNNVEGLRPGKLQAMKDAVAASEELLASEDATVDELKAANRR
ncbi:MAG: hypothetical protein ACLTCB_07010 [Merdibacter sp.]